VNYFLDCEFSALPWEDGSTLISLAVAAEDGREYMAVVEGFAVESCSDFVREHVLPHLPPPSMWRSRAQVRSDLTEFVKDDSDPIFWAWFPDLNGLRSMSEPGPAAQRLARFRDYDWQLVVSLWEDDGLPFTLGGGCRDLHRYSGSLASLPANSSPHDPLSDARWNRAVWMRVTGYEPGEEGSQTR
jgi:hypothetical protein